MTRFIKKRNKRWLLISFLAILLFVSFLFLPRGPQPPSAVRTISELETYMKKLTDFGSPPGISFVVIKNSRVVYSKGFGWADYPRKIAATPEAVYHWYSITKIVTAIAILQLQEKGQLQLSDSVTRYLPFFKVEYPSGPYNAITIRNLLNHSSGLPDAQLDLAKWIHYEGEPPVNQTAFLKKILPKYSKLRYRPGEYSKYNNIEYVVLGAIIEKVSGMSYEEYVQRNILEPLGMTHTGFLYTKSMEPYEVAGSNPLFHFNTLVIPFVRGKVVREVSQSQMWFERFYNDQTPPSALIGSVADASHLVMAYLNNGEYNGKRILSKESVFTMTHDGQMKRKNEDSRSIFRQGIGWQVWLHPGRTVIQHDGGGPGFFTKMRLIPEENLGFVIFTNDAANHRKINKIADLAAGLKW